MNSSCFIAVLLFSMYRLRSFFCSTHLDLEKLTCYPRTIYQTEVLLLQNVVSSHCVRICLRYFLPAFPERCAVQWFNSYRFIKVNDSIELLRHTRSKVVADPFSLRQIDHANGPF